MKRVPFYALGVFLFGFCLVGMALAANPTSGQVASNSDPGTVDNPPVVSVPTPGNSVTTTTYATTDSDTLSYRENKLSKELGLQENLKLSNLDFIKEEMEKTQSSAEPDKAVDIGSQLQEDRLILSQPIPLLMEAS